MANPVIVDCPEKTWTKVATSVMSGMIWVNNPSASYFHTYRLTGEALDIGVFEKTRLSGDSIPIVSSVGIDIYIFCESSDGRVRVDV